MTPLSVDVLKKSISPVAKLVFEKVKAEVQQRRLKIFFEELERHINCRDSESVCEILNKYLDDDERCDRISELIREITLSKSRTYFPKIASIFIAKCVLNNDILTSYQESILAAISELFDDEIEVLYSFIKKQQEQCADIPSYSQLSVDFENSIPDEIEEIDVVVHRIHNGRGNTYFSLANLGRWAVIFENYGILNVIQKQSFETDQLEDVLQSSKTRVVLPGLIRELVEIFHLAGVNETDLIHPMQIT